MPEQVCGWTRDLDWGNVPGWITALTALVVGGFAIANVLIARKAYQDGKWIGKVATARLVWSIVTKGGYLERGEPLPRDARDSHLLLAEVTTVGQGNVKRVNQRSVFAFVEVTNGSGEPIGNIEIVIYDASGRAILDLGHLPIRKVLGPTDVHTWLFVSPAPDEGTPFEETWWSDLRSSIRFRDSAGLIWLRTETAPPDQDEGRVASKAYEKAQAEFWQRTQERRVKAEAKRRAKRGEERRAAKEPSDADDAGDSDA